MYTMMIVDDEKLTRDFIRNHIAKISERWCVTCEAADGEEALRVLQHRDVDLILTDIKMPGMDGLELAKRVHAQHARQKMMILSGYEEFSFAKRAMEYGVQNYLLKPIDNDELAAALENIAKEIEAEKNKELVHRTMTKLSLDLKKHVMKNFLKAVIHERNLEIKSLYPMMFKMKLSLLEGEGIIMVMALDEERLLQKGVPFEDFSIFKFILNEIASEVVEQAGVGQVTLDHDENTVALISCERDQTLTQVCETVHRNVSDVMHEHTGFTITSGCGAAVDDTLQLHVSYEQAKLMLWKKWTGGGRSFYQYEGTKGKERELYDRWISDIVRGLLEENETVYFRAVSDYVRELPDLHTNTIYRFGYYLIHKLKEMLPDISETLVETAVGVLASVGKRGGLQRIGDVTALFQKMIQSFAANHHPFEVFDEKDLVTRVKEYLYAHHAEPISLAHVAEVFDVSPNYLSTLFHKEVGETYIKFLTKVRMEKAAGLLRSHPREKVYHIAEKVGYVSVKHFTYVFKRYYGMPPGEYQHRYIREEEKT